MTRIVTSDIGHRFTCIGQPSVEDFRLTHRQTRHRTSSRSNFGTSRIHTSTSTDTRWSKANGYTSETTRKPNKSACVTGHRVGLHSHYHTTIRSMGGARSARLQRLAHLLASYGKTCATAKDFGTSTWPVLVALCTYRCTLLVLLEMSLDHMEFMGSTNVSKR